MNIPNFKTSFRHTYYSFGWGAVRDVIKVAKDYGDSIFLITTENATGLHQVIFDLKSKAKTAGLSIFHSNSIEPNPDFKSLKEISEKAAEYDVIIGLGGGSVLDAAKALAVFAANRENMDEFFEKENLSFGVTRKKLILIPTTSGTGSELSYGAIISNRAENTKSGIRGEQLAPDVAIVDPSLTVTLPKKLTAETGFDIFTHAFESFLSKKSHNHSRLMSLQAINLIRSNLHQVLNEPDNREFRTNLSYASSMMGLNLASVGTCLPHRLQYPIGGELPSTSHPQGLAWIYPIWVKKVFPYAETDVRDAFRILGVKEPTTAVEASEAIIDWLSKLGIDITPVSKLNPENLCLKVTGNLKVDPIENPEREILNIYSEIFYE